MKKLKIAGWVVLVLLILIVITGFAFVQSLKPDYEGGQDLPGLEEEVTVYYDAYGIPHIYGKNETDAFRALGYVHAQDRLWQMELLRRVAKGGLSEVFGKDLLNTDRFFLSLGIEEATNKTLGNLDRSSEMIRLTQAYLDGVNEFIVEGPTPIEFHLTSLEKQPFTLEDVYNAIGYMSFSFAMAHKTDPLLTKIRDSLGTAYLEDLAIDVDSNTVWIKNYKGDSEQSLSTSTITAVNKALEKLPIPQFIGSNSWVLGPGKTKSGKVILANDPHIGFAQPSVWYEAHVVTPAYEKYGYHLAGVPFPLLGHNRELAYGLTMFENDDIDFYQEQINPEDKTQYMADDAWKTMTTHTKIIKVKDSTPVEFSYRTTRHGPILNGVMDQLNDEGALSMSWIYTQVENRVLNALYGISHATDLQSFKNSLPDIHAPGLNVMYGDAEGNIAWWASAKLYEIPAGTQTKLVLDGNKGAERLRYLDFEENPSAVNPPWEYVYSANNQPDSVSGMKIPGYYLPENRAKRIVALLEPKNDWDRESVGEMITDVTSSVNPEVAGGLLELLNKEDFKGADLQALERLGSWNGDYPVQNLEGPVYHLWIYYLLKLTMEDELGNEKFGQLLGTHFIKRTIAPLAQNDDSVWWDNVSTADRVESRSYIVNKAARMALQSLREDLGEDPNQWTWDKLHTLEHEHPIGKVASLREFFNVGPYPVPGTKEVINNLAFPYNESGKFKVTAGPSTRRVIDFSDIENSMSILPTGQSGNPLSDHYEDQAEMYIQGKFRKMMINKEEIKEKSASVLIFQPN